MALLGKARMTKGLRVGIGALLLAKGGHDIDKTPVVLHPPLGPTSLLLLLLLFGHLEKGKADQTLPGSSMPSLKLISRAREDRQLKSQGSQLICDTKKTKPKGYYSYSHLP